MPHEQAVGKQCVKRRGSLRIHQREQGGLARDQSRGDCQLAMIVVDSHFGFDQPFRAELGGQAIQERQIVRDPPQRPFRGGGPGVIVPDDFKVVAKSSQQGAMDSVSNDHARCFRLIVLT